jgi:hypothetical protein
MPLRPRSGFNTPANRRMQRAVAWDNTLKLWNVAAGR